jgi:hypothetical protein
MKLSLTHRFRVVAGVASCLVAACLLLVSVEGLIDPVSAQMADDLDPFGTPAPRASWGTLSLLALGLFSLGGYALTRGVTPSRAEPCASPNVGPAKLVGNSGVTEGPPSVS